MRRFSIGKLMLLVAFLGTNLGAFRFLLGSSREPDMEKLLLSGFIPLADVALLALYGLATRFRITLRRNRPKSMARFLLGVAAISSLLLAVSALVAFFAMETFYEYVDTISRYPEPLSRRLNLSDPRNAEFGHYVVVPLALGMFLSGPPILWTLATGFLVGHFRLVVETRPSDSDGAAPAGS
jgi:hypothetical protein